MGEMGIEVRCVDLPHPCNPQHSGMGKKHSRCTLLLTTPRELLPAGSAQSRPQAVLISVEADLQPVGELGSCCCS